MTRAKSLEQTRSLLFTTFVNGAKYQFIKPFFKSIVSNINSKIMQRTEKYSLENIREFMNLNRKKNITKALLQALKVIERCRGYSSSPQMPCHSNWIRIDCYKKKA